MGAPAAGLVLVLGVALGEFVPPVPLEMPEALPPPELHGTVTLEITVDPEGEVQHVRVLQTDDPRLRAAALDAATHYRFLPARFEGEAVEVRIQQVVEFAAPEVEPDAYETHVSGVRGRPLAVPRGAELDPAPITSRHRLSRRDIELTVGSLEDIARAIAALPGVVADPGLLATLFIRGGDASEITFYLDGVPLPHGYHLGGFATVFNPELIEGADLYAGAAPAAYRSSLSGVVDLRYLRPPARRYEAVADVSAHTAKAHVAGPTPIDGLSLLLSARRSYFEAYFALLAAAGIVGEGLAAPNIGEYLARATYRRGDDTLDATLLTTTDGLRFISDPSDAALISFDGDLTLENELTLASVRWQRVLAAGASTSFIAAFISDSQRSERRGSDAVAAPVQLADANAETLFVRADLRARAGERHTLHAGVDLSWRRRRVAGVVEDLRALPTWSFPPLADLGLDPVSIAPQDERSALEAYLEDVWQDALPGLTVRAGTRLAVDGRGAFDVSPQLGVSYAPWPGSVLKLAGGLYAQRRDEPLLRDPIVGNPDLGPERVAIGVVGVEQILGPGVLLRAEAYAKHYFQLVVNPDDPARVARGETFANRGHGHAVGADVLLAKRTERFGLGLSYGWLDTVRENPLNQTFEARTPPRQAQAHTLGLSTDAQFGAGWGLALRYAFHTARPVTAVSGWRLDDTGDRARWVAELGEPLADGRRAVNRVVHAPFHELSARLEKRLQFSDWRLTVYAEVLNLTNDVTTFVDTYDRGDPERGIEPAQGRFATLPIRPFLGIRGEL